MKSIPKNTEKYKKLLEIAKSNKKSLADQVDDYDCAIENEKEFAILNYKDAPSSERSPIDSPNVSVNDIRTFIDFWNSRDDVLAQEFEDYKRTLSDKDLFQIANGSEAIWDMSHIKEALPNASYDPDTMADYLDTVEDFKDKEHFLPFWKPNMLHVVLTSDDDEDGFDFVNDDDNED